MTETFKKDVMHKFVDGRYRVHAQPYNGRMVPQAYGPMGRTLQKRYNQFNCWGPGFNNGPSIESFYENQLQGKLELLPEGKMAIVDPMMTMQKSDSPLTNADTGAFNAIFGAAAIIQYAQRAALINGLPHNGWPSSGFRIATTAPISTGGTGVAQSSDRPFTLEPTYLEVPVSPKECAVSTELSDILIIQGETDDAITFSVNKEVTQSAVFDAWDYDMLVDGNTLAGDNFESVDRVTATAALSTAMSWTAADEDLYTLDRTSVTTWDSNASHNSGTDRYLTRPLLDGAIQDASPYWEDPSDWSKAFWLTDHDTMVEWWALEEAKQFLTTERAQFGLNGVNTQAGQDTGVVVAKYKGIPVIQDKNVTADDIGRIYLLNTDFLGLSFGRPMEFLTNDNPFVVGFNMLGLWHWIGELRATKPVACASIRDLKN